MVGDNIVGGNVVNDSDTTSKNNGCTSEMKSNPIASNSGGSSINGDNSCKYTMRDIIPNSSTDTAHKKTDGKQKMNEMGSNAVAQDNVEKGTIHPATGIHINATHTKTGYGANDTIIERKQIEQETDEKMNESAAALMFGETRKYPVIDAGMLMSCSNMNDGGYYRSNETCLKQNMIDNKYYNDYNNSNWNMEHIHLDSSAIFAQMQVEATLQTKPRFGDYNFNALFEKYPKPYGIDFQLGFTATEVFTVCYIFCTQSDLWVI